MVQLLLLLTGALAVGAIVFGVAALITGGDGLADVEPDGRSVPLPGARPLVETDVDAVRFDTVLRGYRMGQVDQALRRAAYDIGYKSELIQVLEAEIEALRQGRTADADALRVTRLAALGADAAPEAAPDALMTSGDLTADGGSTPDGPTSSEDSDGSAAPAADTEVRQATVSLAKTAVPPAVDGDAADAAPVSTDAVDGSAPEGQSPTPDPQNAEDRADSGQPSAAAGV